MEDKEKKISMVGSLIERVEEYGKMTYELFKLKSIDKISNEVSSVISHLCAIIFVLIFIFILNIAVALWLGEILGNNYYGFFCVAAFDVLVWIILHFILHNWIKKSIYNSIISKIVS